MAHRGARKGMEHMKIPIISGRIRIAIGTPCYRRSVDMRHIEQALKLMAACTPASGFEFIGVTQTDSCNLDWSRNSLLTFAIENRCDWLLMVDADTYHVGAADTLRMIGEADRARAAVAAAPVKMRRRSDGYNVRRVEGGEVRIFEDWRGKLVEVDAVGTAFMAISCRWIVEHWREQPWFLTRHLPGPKPERLGEDVCFCLGVRERGGVVLCDGRFEPHHEGAEYGDAA